MKYLLLFLLFLSSSFANIAKVSAVVGDARIERANKNIVVKIGISLLEKDIIHTAKNAKVQLIFKDDTIVTLGKNSALNIDTYLYDIKNPKNSKTNLNFFKGAFKTITGKIGKINREKFKLKTKSASIGIRGTIILGNQEVIACTQGGISVESIGTGTKVEVNANELTTVQENGDLSAPEEYTQDSINKLSSELEPEEETSTNSQEESDNTESNTSNSSEESEQTEESDEIEETEQEENSTVQENSEDTETSTQEDTASIDDQENSNESTESLENDSSLDNSSSNVSSNDVGDLSTSSVSEQTSDITETAQDIVDDSSENEIEQPRVSLSFVGKSLGAYVENSDSSTRDANSFNFQDNTNASGEIGVFRATRVDNKITIDERFSRLSYDSDNTFVKKDIKRTFSSLGTPSKGGYTGHSDLTSSTDAIPFSYTSNASTISGNYKIEVDNMGEVFILYYDGNPFNVSSGGSAEYNELIVFGKNGLLSEQDKTKIYVYKDFINMSFQKDSAGKYTESSLDKNTDAGFEYFNAKLKSLTHLNKDFHKSGAEEFIVGKNNSVKSYRNKYNFNYKNSSLNLSSYISANTNGSIKLLGTDIQAINYYITSSESKKDFSSSVTTSNTTRTNGASFLLKDKISDAKTSGTLTHSGFINSNAFGRDSSNTTLIKSSNNLTLTISRGKGDISGSATIDTQTSPENKITMTFNGKITNNTSYYINDDIFGVMADTSNSNYKVEDNEYNLDSNTGYLIAVPDGAFIDNEFKLFDSDDNPLTSDDDSSWGYWTAKFSKSSLNSNEYFVSPFSTWVSGIQTSTSIMDDVLDATSNTRYSFEGAVIGTVLNASSGNLESIITDGSAVNSVKMNFDLGGGSNSLTSSTMNFSSANTQWNMNVNSTEISNTGFSGSLSGTNITGSLEGKFYGSGSIKSVGGSFNSSLDASGSAENGVSTIHKAQGVFKAVKK
ncbi:FecR family protein [Poseidonibacter lekithochrous]|uniref:FecR family protein n=1 Tax=Poseidonibacter lekithochrous TaxID=1904463 RepID=UPI0008FC77BB|nr:FecR family protein [Poseidonibacter lekithochrous]QKJ23590.1 FecR domain-containing protein [Poseidonibacter lekithochrous]